MTKCFTTYWRPDGWRGLDIGAPILYAGGSDFTKRGVVPGSRMYVLNIVGGGVRLLGAFTVERVVNQEDARKLVRSPWDADEHLIADAGASAAFRFRELPDNLVRRLRFRVGGAEVELKYKQSGSVDGQTLRGVRELTPKSVALLEDFLSTDGEPEATSTDAASTRRTPGGGPIPVMDDEGRFLKAHFQVVPVSGQMHIVVESRGGTIGSPDERNPEYSAGLRVIVSRLAGLGIAIEDAVVESAPLLKRGLGDADRRVQGLDFPLRLSPASDAADIAARLQRGQKAVGSEAATERGNSTRRLLMKVAVDSHTVERFSEILAFGPQAGKHPVPLGPVSEADVAGGTSDDEEDFSPNGLVDARHRILASLAQRLGQPKFRRKVLAAYGHRCAITQCTVLEVLEAAHIIPYWGPETNHVQNGILLRSDLHTMFDRGLFGIDPATWRVRMPAKLKSTSYAFLEGAKVSLPAESHSWPNSEALNRHLRAIGLD